MNILYTAFEYDSFSGVPSFTRDLATGLARRGHQVAIYGMRVGKIAKATDPSVFVTSRLDRLPFRPEIIHAQQQPTIVQALLAYPETPLITVCHDATSERDEPFYAPGIARYVAVDKRCEARIARVRAIPRADTRMIMNAVDLNRFSPAGALPPKPKRALIYSNYAKRNSQLEPIARACRKLGIDVLVVGEGLRRTSITPEKELPLFDIVFAKARCALEAMAMGRSVILCDASGLGKMVSSVDLERFRPMNFGAGLLDRSLDEDLIVGEIGKYDAGDAARVAAWIRNEASLTVALDRWMELYREVLASPRMVQDDAWRRDQARRYRWWGQYSTVYRLTRLLGVRHIARIPVIGRALHHALLSMWNRFWR